MVDPSGAGVGLRPLQPPCPHQQRVETRGGSRACNVDFSPHTDVQVRMLGPARASGTVQSTHGWALSLDNEWR